MSYIKINGDNTHYIVSIMPFTTQHGYNAIRFIGEDIPETDKGFKLYDDNERTIINKKVDQIYNEVTNENMTTKDKIKAIHDYIINNSIYDEEPADNLNNPNDIAK